MPVDGVYAPSTGNSFHVAHSTWCVIGKDHPICIYTFVTTKPNLLLTLNFTMAIDDPLTIENREGKTPGTRVIRLSGPLTLHNLFEFQTEIRSGQPPSAAIFDLTGVPYMDSAGMGAIVNYYVHCQNCGTRMIVAGVNSRVMELFKLTKVNTVIPLTATVEEAEVRA